MKVKLPNSKAILGYHDFFKEAPPERLSLIKNICKTNLIAEISGLNYRLKPNNQIYIDDSFKTQDRELLYFSGEQELLYEKYGSIAQKFVRRKNDYPLLFTRQTCLFALEEIINSDLKVIPHFSMSDHWENLLKYLFAVNSAITTFKKEAEEADFDQIKNFNDVTIDEEKPALSLEDVSVKTIVLNELNVSTNQLYVPYRAYHFLKFLTGHPQVGELASDYLHENYQINFEQFVFEIFSLYIGNNPDGTNNIKSAGLGLPIDTTFIYYPTELNKKLFETLSQTFNNTEYQKLLSIRKYPMYNASDSFILTDNNILLEKSYSQFINDFWFDKIKNITNEKGKMMFNIKGYRAIIGEFFENYLKQILIYITKNAKHFKVYSFEQLLMQIDGQQNELTDIYIRYTNKVFIAEAKSTGLYDKEKYSGDLNEFYREGRESFFDSYGMTQLVKAITRLQEKVKTFDQGFPEKGNIKLFPAIIVNEKALQTPLMAQIFNQRFQELINPLEFEKLKIAPLSLIHISDLENMEEYLHTQPSQFWRILSFHTSHTAFMPPFFNTLNVLKVKPTYQKPEVLYKEWIKKFSEPQ